MPDAVETAVVKMAESNPWYGYKRIAMMCRRAGERISDRQAYLAMRAHDLLHRRRRVRPAALYQASKLFELLPTAVNGLWQTDVTYIHIPGHGWWYSVAVIDYYSRFLLALELTASYSAAEVIRVLDQARAEAERLHGALPKTPFLVTGNGPLFIARKFVHHVTGMFTHVRIQYRTPTQLRLIERFNGTLKAEEVYWRTYDNPHDARVCLAKFRRRYNHDRPHWALRPAEGGDPLVPADVYVSGRQTQIPRWQPWAKAAKRTLDELLNEAA